MSRFISDHAVMAFSVIYYELIGNKMIKNKKDLADKLGTYSHVVNDILKGKRRPTIDQISILVNTMGIDANAFFTSTEDNFRDSIGAIKRIQNFEDHTIQIKRKTLTKVISFLGGELDKLNK